MNVTHSHLSIKHGAAGVGLFVRWIKRDILIPREP